MDEQDRKNQSVIDFFNQVSIDLKINKAFIDSVTCLNGRDKREIVTVIRDGETVITVVEPTFR